MKYSYSSKYTVRIKYHRLFLKTVSHTYIRKVLRMLKIHVVMYKKGPDLYNKVFTLPTVPKVYYFL